MTTVLPKTPGAIEELRAYCKFALSPAGGPARRDAPPTAADRSAVLPQQTVAERLGGPRNKAPADRRGTPVTKLLRPLGRARNNAAESLRGVKTVGVRSRCCMEGRPDLRRPAFTFSRNRSHMRTNRIMIVVTARYTDVLIAHRSLRLEGVLFGRYTHLVSRSRPVPSLLVLDELDDPRLRRACLVDAERLRAVLPRRGRRRVHAYGHLS